MAILQGRICGVYRITCTATGKVYIGSSNHIKRRWHGHRSQLRRNVHSIPALQAEWNRHGEEAFIFEVIEMCLDALRTDREDYWIRHYHAADSAYGYNIAPSAVDLSIKSDETRAKLAAASRNKSPEHRAKISAANSRRQWSDESRAKVSASLTGKRLSAETRAKMSATRTGKVFPPEQIANMRAGQQAWRARQRKEKA